MVITWEEYFMGVAILSSYRSKDPNTKVGACIVNQDKKIVSLGYNGFPISKTDNDNTYPWERERNPLETKYPYVVHAELNAILNSRADLRNCTIYVTLFPCNECCKAIIQSGIKEMVYLSNKYADSDSTKASVKMLDNAGIVCRQYTPSGKNINLEI